MGDNSEIQKLRVDNKTGPLVGKRCKTKFCVAYGLGTSGKDILLTTRIFVDKSKKDMKRERRNKKSKMKRNSLSGLS